MNQNYDVCIIGAGASGLAAANILDPALRICVIDKNEIPGRKILATGGGKCNLTNRACRRHELTLDFFSGLGLETRCDDEGRYYPYSQVASDVVRSLTGPLEKRDIDWRLGERVIGIRRAEPDSVRGEDPDIGVDETAYSIMTEKMGGPKKDAPGQDTKDAPEHAPKNTPNNEIHAKKVILCTGGKAAPGFGTTGDGYSLAKSMGHGITRTYPILTGINVDIPGTLAGIRAKGKVSLLEDDRAVASEAGEIQFTADGISGICVFDLTPFIKIRPGESPKEGLGRFCIQMDLAPDMTEEEVSSRGDSFGIVTTALAEWIEPARLKKIMLPVKGVWGWDRAQCTAGGVSTEEIDDETMESTICPGLYFAGELMDVQGPCGGYNLQHAWESGIAAAKAINVSLAKPADASSAKATDASSAKPADESLSKANDGTPDNSPCER